VSPASTAAPANAIQVVNSDEPFNSLRRRFNSVSDCCAEIGALKVILRAIAKGRDAVTTLVIIARFAGRFGSSMSDPDPPADGNLARRVPPLTLQPEGRRGDFFEMELHRLGVGEGQRKRGPDDRRCRSADRRAAAAAFLAWPIAARGRFSGRCGPHPGTRLRLTSSAAGRRDARSARAGCLKGIPL
jgi:hypothetical protein